MSGDLGTRDQQLSALAVRMRAHVKVKDRWYHLKIYPKCFLGSEGASWLVTSGEAKDIASALKLGNQMIRAGLFHHVTREHLFEDARLFYRFAEDESAQVISGSGESGLTSTKILTAEQVKEREGAGPDSVEEDVEDKLDGHRPASCLVESATLSAADKRKNSGADDDSKEQHQQDLTAMVSRQLNDLEMAIQLQRQLYASARRTSQYLLAILGCTVCLGLKFWIVLSLLGLLWWLRQRDFDNTFLRMTTEEDNLPYPSSRSASGTAGAAVNEAIGVDGERNMKSPYGTRTFTTAGTLLPPAESWPLRPVLLRLTSDHPASPTESHANTFCTVPIKTAQFEGRMLVLLRNAPCPGGVKDKRDLDQYFQGHRRVSVNYVQGRFKQRLPMDQVFTGQTFKRPLINMPSQMLMKMAFGFLRGLAPALHADVTSVMPYVLTPLISAAQSIHVTSSSDTAPELTRVAKREISDEDMEDTRLIFSSQKGQEDDDDDCTSIVNDGGGEDGGRKSRNRLSAANRRKLFKNPRALRGKFFNPAHTYTFGFWQDLFDPVDYCVHLPFGKFDVSEYLDGQPLQIQAQVGVQSSLNKAELWRVELWNEKLLVGLAKAKVEGRA